LQSRDDGTTWRCMVRTPHWHLSGLRQHRAMAPRDRRPSRQRLFVPVLTTAAALLAQLPVLRPNCHAARPNLEPNQSAGECGRCCEVDRPRASKACLQQSPNGCVHQMRYQRFHDNPQQQHQQWHNHPPLPVAPPYVAGSLVGGVCERRWDKAKSNP
jgi:hypothetical protein